MRSAAFRSLVRGAARDVHRSVFDRDASTVTLTVADAGVLLAEALSHLRPDLAERLPADLRAGLRGLERRPRRAAVRLAALAERVRDVALLGFARRWRCCSRSARCSRAGAARRRAAARASRSRWSRA